VGTEQTAECSPTSNTKCRDCSPVDNAYFIAVGSCEFRCKEHFHKSSDGASCYACSTCGDNEYQDAGCSETEDAVCKVKGALGDLYDLTTSDDNTPGHIDLSGLNFAFTRPVVIVSPPSYNGNTACVLRVGKTALPQGYKVFLAEPDYTNSTHEAETGSYLVLEQGLGSNYFVGTVQVDSEDGHTKVTLPDSPALGLRPWVFQLVQSSTNSSAFVKTRMSLSGNSAREFELWLEADESDRNNTGSAVVGYVAINSGCATTQLDGDSSSFGAVCLNQYGSISLDGHVHDYALGIVDTAAGINNIQIASFGKEFTAPPRVFANMQTARGVRAADLRTKGIDELSFKFVVEEDQSEPIEDKHPSEWVAWLAIGTFLHT